MLAATGFIVQAAGIHLPGMLTEGVSFASLSKIKSPIEQWFAMPDIGMFVRQHIYLYFCRMP